MLELNANKKLLQQHIQNKSGRVTLLKDIHNVGSASRKIDRSKEIEQAVLELKKAEGINPFNPFLCMPNQLGCNYIWQFTSLILIWLICSSSQY